MENKKETQTVQSMIVFIIMAVCAFTISTTTGWLAGFAALILGMTVIVMSLVTLFIVGFFVFTNPPATMSEEERSNFRKVSAKLRGPYDSKKAQITHAIAVAVIVSSCYVLNQYYEGGFWAGLVMLCSVIWVTISMGSFIWKNIFIGGRNESDNS